MYAEAFKFSEQKIEESINIKLLRIRLWMLRNWIYWGPVSILIFAKSDYIPVRILNSRTDNKTLAMQW